MSFFGTRRTRQSQARVFRPAPSLWDRLTAAFRDYRVLSQVLIALLTVLLLLCALQAWKPRFLYRAGRFVDVGVQSRIDFEVENVAETLRIRRDAEAAAPLVLIQEATVIDRLVSKLRAQLSEVSNAKSIDQLSKPTLDAFGFSALNGTEREQAFSLLRNPLQDADESSGKRLDELMLEVEKLLADARNVGLISILEARRLTGDPLDDPTPLNRNRSIKVVNSNGELLHNGVLADVLLQEQIRETGRLGKLWPTLTKLSVIKPSLELWLQQNLKNQLQLDSERQTAELQSASEGAQRRFDRYAQRTRFWCRQVISLRKQKKDWGFCGWNTRPMRQAVTPWQRLSQINGIATLLLLLVVLFGVFPEVFCPGNARREFSPDWIRWHLFSNGISKPFDECRSLAGRNHSATGHGDDYRDCLQSDCCRADGVYVVAAGVDGHAG